MPRTADNDLKDVVFYLFPSNVAAPVGLDENGDAFKGKPCMLKDIIDFAKREGLITP